MAETTILSAGTTAATSTSVTLTAGSTVLISMFIAAGGISESATMDILLDITAGADVKLFTLKGSSAAQVITNNTTTTWTLKVARPAQSDSVGAISIS